MNIHLEEYVNEYYTGYKALKADYKNPEYDFILANKHHHIKVELKEFSGFDNYSSDEPYEEHICLEVFQYLSKMMDDYYYSRREGVVISSANYLERQTPVDIIKSVGWLFKETADRLWIVKKKKSETKILDIDLSSLKSWLLAGVYYQNEEVREPLTLKTIHAGHNPPSYYKLDTNKKVDMNGTNVVILESELPKSIYHKVVY